MKFANGSWRLKAFLSVMILWQTSRVCAKEEGLHIQICQWKKKTNHNTTIFNSFSPQKLEDIVLLMTLIKYVTNTCALTHVLLCRQTVQLRVRDRTLLNITAKKKVCQDLNFLSQCIYSHSYLIKIPTHSNPKTLQEPYALASFPVAAQGK